MVEAVHGCFYGSETEGDERKREERKEREREEERENPEREKKERKTLGARVRCEIGNGEEEEESGSEGVVLLLRS